MLEHHGYQMLNYQSKIQMFSNTSYFLIIIARKKVQYHFTSSNNLNKKSNIFYIKFKFSIKNIN